MLYAVSGLVVAGVMLFSSAVFAQHSSTTPSNPPPSPPPGAAPSTPPPAPALGPGSSISLSTSSASSVPSASHSSAPSSPSLVSIPESHAAPMPGSSDSRASGDEGRIVRSPRTGEAPPTKDTKEKDSKSSEADLRRGICLDSPCQKPELKPAESDLRRPICKDRDCVRCPAGESVGKNGACVSTTAAAANTPVNAAVSHECPATETWNGAACVVSARQCRPNEYWNGASCVASTAECVSIDSRAAMLADEIRGDRAQMQNACSEDPYGQECNRLTRSYDGAVQRYRMLIGEAPVSCRPTLADPLSL
jgi:hypothetical protein